MRNNKIDMVVTLFTTCAVFWLNIMTIFTMKISLPRRRYRGFVKHSSLGPSSTVAEKSEKNIGERSEPIRRLGRMALPPPQSTARLFLLSDFLCPFTPFFAIFPHSGAWSYEVAWISGLPKGLRGGRDNSEIKKSQSCDDFIFTEPYHYNLSAYTSGRFLSRLSSYEVVLK